MNNQTIFDFIKDIPIQKEKLKYTKSQIQKWRTALQKYWDKQSQEEGSRSGYCVCGYMNYCDWCLGADMAKPCVKAIITMLKEQEKEIDYANFDFEKLMEEI